MCTSATSAVAQTLVYPRLATRFEQEAVGSHCGQPGRRLGNVLQIDESVHPLERCDFFPSNRSTCFMPGHNGLLSTERVFTCLDSCECPVTSSIWFRLRVSAFVHPHWCNDLECDCCHEWRRYTAPFGIWVIYKSRIASMFPGKSHHIRSHLPQKKAQGLREKPRTL